MGMAKSIYQPPVLNYFSPKDLPFLESNLTKKKLGHEVHEPKISLSIDSYGFISTLQLC